LGSVNLTGAGNAFSNASSPLITQMYGAVAQSNCNAFEVLPTSGTISGTFTLYGLA